MIKPILIAITPPLTIFFLQWRVKKWRKMHLTLFAMFFWLMAILPTAYPVFIAFAMHIEDEYPPQKIQKMSVANTFNNLPILTTWYDPELGGINCQEPCDIYANGERVIESHYYGNTDQTAACLPEWLGREITIQGLGTFKCRDTGGAIKVAYSEYFSRMVIHVDILAHPGEMFCNACLWNEWRLK